jgi:hypothetical protein
MKGYFTHSFDLCKTGRIFLEYLSEIRRELISAGILVVYGPITFRYREAIELRKSDRGGTCIKVALMYNCIISARILYVFDDDIAYLKCALSKSHFK